jgi:excisionase family DNA binding protein
MKPCRKYPIPEPGKVGLTLAETCGLLGAGMTTVRKAIDIGQLPARKLGKKVIVMRADVDQFLKNLPPAGQTRA